MLIKTIEIKNFRGIKDQTIPLNQYTCFVGANGAGKSTVLCALNVFFQEQASSSTDTQKLCDEDFFARNVQEPISITLTFCNLNDDAKEELSAYVRRDELVVTAEASFDEDTKTASVKHFGQRLGMPRFRSFFEAVKASAKKPELDAIYSDLQGEYEGLPNATSKDAKVSALQQFEADNPSLCELIPSEDSFYGINGAGKLAPFIQWVYVPAVKDAKEEGEEGKNTALAKLIARVVRSKTNFDAELEALRKETLEKYTALLDGNKSGLEQLSASLKKRLESFAHPNAQINLSWVTNDRKSVQVTPPIAGIQAGDGAFTASLERMGHGLQRSYLLALLQELATSDDDDAATLLLGCEEPELYQHPPQARHLADVFNRLAVGNNQVLVTTHSPLFVCGRGFENVRMVRSGALASGACITSTTFDSLCAEIRNARGDDTGRKLEGMIAKIHQSLQPNIGEMFFARLPIFVEGLEDVSYITTHLILTERWDEFRRLGCHLVPVNGKDKLIQPVAIAKLLEIPKYVVFDSDGNTVRPDHRNKHEIDNKAILWLLGSTINAFPDNDHIGDCYAVWETSLTERVEEDFGEKARDYKNVASEHYAHEGGLQKHDLFIADFLAAAFEDGNRSSTLNSLCDSILEYAGANALS
jgi:putative ATP-dependent endonuclease of OLD family